MINGKFRQVAEDFYVAPQLEANDFADAKAIGIKSIINNRPDGEEAGQLPDAEARQCAEAVDLNYEHVPVVSGGIFPDHIANMLKATKAHPGPYLAYCRSGTRSCFLWSFVAAQKANPEDVIRSAAKAGYDVSQIAGILQSIHESQSD